MKLEVDELTQEFKFWVVLVKDGMTVNPFHAIGYVENPTENDLDLLEKELSEDEEFDITDFIRGLDYDFLVVSDEKFKQLIEIIDDNYKVTNPKIKRVDGQTIN